MIGNFSYCNPTRLYFGQQSLEGLNQELPKYAYPLDVKLEAIYPSGLTEEIISLKHPGGTLTIPYYQEPGTVLVLNILNKEVGRFEVTK